MCDWEEFRFVCNHSALRLKSHCHFARNDPNHQCFGVKVLRDSWYLDGQLCDKCLLENGFRLQQHQHQQQKKNDGASQRAR